MVVTKPNPGDVLAAARAAFKNGNYPEALEQYEYFFEHALATEPSYFGVRLSYCLDEWARLGLCYPVALQRLQQKADEALVLLAETRDPARFQDYVSICGYLNQQEESVRRFLAFHSSDCTLANLIVTHVWNELVEEEQWAVCSAYLPMAKEAYEIVLLRFDQASAIGKSEPSLGGSEFQQHIDGLIVQDVCSLLKVLKCSGRLEDAALVQSLLKSDMESRGQTHLLDRIGMEHSA